MDYNKLVWREDMVSFVLNWLRDHVVVMLKYEPIGLSLFFQEGIIPFTRHPNFTVSAVLWMGNHPDTPFLPTSKTLKTPPYAMVLQSDERYVPIYNLPALLGPDHLQQAQGLRPNSSSGCIFVRQCYKTTRLQLALWKLVGYLNPPIDGAHTSIEWGKGIPTDWMKDPEMVEGSQED